MYQQSEKLLNSNISSRYLPHNMVNFGLLTAEISWRIWCTPVNFNGFRVFASLLQRRRSLESGGQPNLARCLIVSSAGTLYIHLRGLLPPDEILPGAKFILHPSLAFSYIGIVTARHSSSGVLQGMELRNFRRGRNLYWAGRPSGWASAHILFNS